MECKRGKPLSPKGRSLLNVPFSLYGLPGTHLFPSRFACDYIPCCLDNT